MWSFLRLEDPGCTLEDSNDTSTPFGALAQISNTLRSAEAMADPLEIRRQIFDVLPENGAKKLLAKRWFASGEKAFYPKNFADAERRDSSGKLSSSDKTLLVWSITGEEPPEGFAGLSLIDASARNSVLKIFERTGDIQALLLFLAPKTEHYSVGVFLDYLLFALTYLPDDIDTRELLDAVAARPNASSELLTAVINLHTRKDADSLGVVQRLAAGNDAGAAAALYAFDPGALPDAANALKRAAAAGNMTAAYFLVRDLDEKSEEIRELAESSALSGSFVAENGIRPEARFFKALREEDGKTLAEAIKKLSQTEAKRLSGLWRRAAAENRSPEKLADIYAIGSVIDQAAGMKVEDLLYKATALGNLDALLDLYDLFAEKNYPVYQKRLREIALANYKLTPRQKARLGLLKVVNV